MYKEEKMESIIKNTGIRAEDIPTKKHMQEIIDYLARHDDPHPGCWVNGATALGDFNIAGKNYRTFTTPVFAYLAWADTKSLPEAVENQTSVSLQEGFTSSFSTEVKTNTSVESKIDIVNIKSDLTLGFTAAKAWSSTTTTSETVTLKGPGTFKFYQIVLVYAHMAVDAAPCYKYFRYCARITPENINDLAFLSGVNTNKTVYIRADKNPITLFNWDDIQTLVINSHEWVNNTGKFSFNLKTPSLY
jgi:hypothetical protein